MANAPGDAQAGAPMTAFTFPDSPRVLAMGADLKASACFARGGVARFAGGMGDLQDASVFEQYLEAIHALEEAGGRPDLIACDAHPGYISSGLARDRGLPLLEVQHHHAHVASVMAEHGLAGPVIGVAMDGAGYGEDGAIWGGEFLLCHGASFARFAHLEYAPLVGGDQASRDAGQAAACHLLHLGLDVPADLHPAPELLRSAMDADVGCAMSSSMGRLFDVVAALLGVCGYNEHEGQCAILLQKCAEEAKHSGVTPASMAFDANQSSGVVRIGTASIIRNALAWRGRDAGAFALGFHHAVAEMVGGILALARRERGVDTAVLAGGVFQNALLLDLCRNAAAREGLALVVNERVPRGDGGLALGQAYVAACRAENGGPFAG